MSTKHGTAIEWTHVPGYKGETWNPWVGCSKVSAGCGNCWAARQANRFKTTRPQYEGVVRDGKWTGRVNAADDPQFYAPIGWRDPRAIFVGSMTDFFHEGADDWREYIWHVMHDTPQHLYLILTKRPERIPECLPSFGKREWPWPNVWLGASVENQEAADKRVPELLRVPAAKRFLSMEPLLGPVDTIRWLCKQDKERITKEGKRTIYRRGIHWIIVGAESGPGARPMHEGWVRSVRDQCQAADVPYFFKQWGKWLPYCQATPEQNAAAKLSRSSLAGTGHSNDVGHWLRLGKKRAGRLLDGRTWEEFPK